MLPKISSKVGNNAIHAIPQASASNDTAPNDAKESKTKTLPQQLEKKNEQKEPKPKEVRSNNTTPNDAKQSKTKTLPRQSEEKNEQKEPKTNEVRSLKPKSKNVKVNKE